MANNITHSWSIKEIFTHDLNSNCVSKIVGQLTSDFGEGPVVSDHEFFVAPNYLPDIPVEYDEDGNVLPPSFPDTTTINWVDELEGFIPVANLTESLVWQWIDKSYNRREIELEVESANNSNSESSYTSIPLPW